MGERPKDLHEQAVRILEAAGARPGPGTVNEEAARRLIDAGWRPPHLRPHASRCRLDTDHEGDCTWPEPPAAEPLFEGCIYSYGAGADTNSVTLLLDPGPDDGPGTGTEVAVYRKGEGPARWPAHDPRCQDEVDHDSDCTWPVEPDSGDQGSAARPGQRPVAPPANLAEAVDRAATLLAEVEGFTVLGSTDRRHLTAHLHVLGVTVRPRPKTDAERLAEAIVRGGIDPKVFDVDGMARAFLAEGITPPEPKVRWTVDREGCLYDGGTMEVAGPVAPGNRELMERIARLLNEEDERG